MWTEAARKQHAPCKGRYPSDLTDEEWALIEPLIPAAKRGGGKRTVVMREVVNGVMYVLIMADEKTALTRRPGDRVPECQASWLCRLDCR